MHTTVSVCSGCAEIVLLACHWGRILKSTPYLPKAEVSNPAPGVPSSCRFELQHTFALEVSSESEDVD